MFIIFENVVCENKCLIISSITREPLNTTIDPFKKTKKPSKVGYPLVLIRVFQENQERRTSEIQTCLWIWKSQHVKEDSSGRS